MQCPTCDNVNLAMADRHGIEIDYCPQCRGIWLDRGELDRLIERAETAARPRCQARRRLVATHLHATRTTTAIATTATRPTTARSDRSRCSANCSTSDRPARARPGA